MPGFLQTFLQTFTYVALILILLAAGMGVPIPEDIPLVTAGYLTNKTNSPIAKIDTDGDGKPDAVDPERQRRVPNLYIMIVAGMVGVLGGDSIVYYIGRKGIDSNNFVARHLRKVLHSKRREKAERHFAKHGNLTVFCGRFMPGFRSIVFAMAGMARMKYWRFLAIDGFAALISVPTFIIIGHYLADYLPPEEITRKIDEFKHLLMPGIIVLVVVGVIYYFFRRRRAAIAEKAALAAISSTGDVDPASDATVNGAATPHVPGVPAETRT